MSNDSGSFTSIQRSCVQKNRNFILLVCCACRKSRPAIEMAEFDWRAENERMVQRHVILVSLMEGKSPQEIIEWTRYPSSLVYAIYREWKDTGDVAGMMCRWANSHAGTLGRDQDHTGTS